MTTWQEVVDHYVDVHGYSDQVQVRDWWFVSVSDLSRPEGSRHLGCAVVCAPTIEDAEETGLRLCPSTFGEIDVLAMPAGQAEYDLGPGWFDHDSLALWCR